MPGRLQFVFPSSKFKPDFWTQLYRLKLEQLKLDTSIIDVQAIYQNSSVTPRNDMSLWFTYESLNNGKNTSSNFRNRYITCKLKIFENFVEFNQAPDYAHQIMTNLWDNIKTGRVFDEHQLFNVCLLCVYMDLKKYVFYHWFAFPVFQMTQSIVYEELFILSNIIDKNEEDLIAEQIDSIWTHVDPNVSVFLYDDKIVKKLEFVDIINFKSDKLILLIPDFTNNPKFPAWNLRNILFAISYHIPEKTELSLICYRQDLYKNISMSILFVSQIIPMTSDKINFENGIPKYSAYWEKNTLDKTKPEGELIPQYTDMSEHINPNKLVESAVLLNTKLMKWRVSPDLDLDMIADTKCLIIGAGTLGCQIAHMLIGWGVTTITFVDYGEVSYSNPTRQILYRQSDVGKNKAITAAKNLTKIYPNITSRGVGLKVPMPGHSEPTEDIFNKSTILDTLIRDHDAIFLVTDSREARWLPSVIFREHQLNRRQAVSDYKNTEKICITAAIGFDTFVVMRHGRMEHEDDKLEWGCYFCQDILEPKNSQDNATMDQKCTVTRPGVAGIVSGYAVELMVSCIADRQHLQKPLTKINIIPQQIRGDLSTFETKISMGPQSSCCLACSDSVMAFFEADEALELINGVINNPKILHDIVGFNNDITDNLIQDMDKIMSEIDKTTDTENESIC